MVFNAGGNHKRLGVFFFLHAHALGLWGVNLSNVLKAHGYEMLVPYVFACNSIAALISPLAIGTLADQRIAPERLLRILGVGAAVFLSLFFYGIQQQWAPLVIIGLAMVHALWSAPTFGLTTSLVLSRLEAPGREFGPIRAWATVGWMAAGWMISFVLNADKSVVAGFAASVAWLLAVAFSFSLSPSPKRVPILGGGKNWKEVFGLDALHLLRHPDHKVVFIASGLLNMALAAFYPFTVLHLDDKGVKFSTAVMSIGQITEIIAMLWLSAMLLKFRLKWVFLAGIGFGVIRYALFALDEKWALFVGIFLHGFCFTLYFITAQIYVEQRVPIHMRARAQALMTFMVSGLGNLFGALSCGWWRHACMTEAGGTRTDWPVFWGGMTFLTLGVFVFFAVAYRGKPTGDASVRELDGGESRERRT